ncbi:TetR/AcrR family transcriptional regulator [Streptomyces virginiae]|uniref:TetR/AcrR family transcriptional regulator n=1 Tax=Streptomyces virginiae TaxID=1961 RepID=UPI0036FB5B27
MARPRGVEDAVILQAAARVMGRVGPTGLTLAAVAREVGLVPGTLVQRFGSKRGLLLALADRSAKEAGRAAGRVRDAGTSALDALAALTSRNLAGMDTPESFAHHLAFLCTDLTDPQLYERALAVHRAQRRAIEELLAEAADAGELRAGTDVAALAGTVQAITAGAGLAWAVERRGSLAQRLRGELDAVLLAHLPPRHPHGPEE